MSGLTQTLAPRPRAGEVSAWLIVAAPIVLVLICALARFDIIELSQTWRAALLFAREEELFAGPPAVEMLEILASKS